MRRDLAEMPWRCASASARTRPSGADMREQLPHQPGLARQSLRRRPHAAALRIAQQASRDWSGRQARPAPDARRRNRAAARSSARIAPASKQNWVTMWTAMPVCRRRRSCPSARGRAPAARCADGRRDSRRCRSRGCRGACSAPLSITSSALRNAPAGWSRSPAMTSTRATPASPVSAGEEIVERRLAREVAHREMRHRLEARRRRSDRRLDRLLRRPRRHRADIDPRAGRRDLAPVRDLRRRRPRRFQRVAARELRDRLDRIGPRFELCCGCGSWHHFGGHRSDVGFAQ